MYFRVVFSTVHETTTEGIITFCDLLLRHLTRTSCQSFETVVATKNSTAIPSTARPAL